MPVYQSRIGKPLNQPEPPPPDRRLFVQLNEMKQEQRQALWRAMKKTNHGMVKIMTEDNFINEFIQAYGANFMMERTEVETLIKTEGMIYEDF